MDEIEYKIAWLNTQRDSLLKMMQSPSRDERIALIDEMIDELQGENNNPPPARG